MTTPHPQDKSALKLLDELEAGNFLQHDSACSVYLAEELRKPCDCGLDRIFPALRARIEAMQKDMKEINLMSKDAMSHNTMSIIGRLMNCYALSVKHLPEAP